MIAFALPDLDATGRLAAALAHVLGANDVLELVGEIGAGKTTFTGALARELGVTEQVRSPTYTVAHAYRRADGTQLAHLDCYRSRGTLDEAAWGDVEPYFDGGIVVVEWPQPVRAWITDRRTWTMHLTAVSADARTAVIDAPDLDAAHALLRAWRR